MSLTILRPDDGDQDGYAVSVDNDADGTGSICARVKFDGNDSVAIVDGAGRDARGALSVYAAIFSSPDGHSIPPDKASDAEAFTGGGFDPEKGNAVPFWLFDNIPDAMTNSDNYLFVWGIDGTTVTQCVHSFVGMRNDDNSTECEPRDQIRRDPQSGGNRTRNLAVATAPHPSVVVHPRIWNLNTGVPQFDKNKYKEFWGNHALSARLATFGAHGRMIWANNPLPFDMTEYTPGLIMLICENPNPKTFRLVLGSIEKPKIGFIQSAGLWDPSKANELDWAEGDAADGVHVPHSFTVTV